MQATYLSVIHKLPSSRDGDTQGGNTYDEHLFELIANDLISQGYSIRPSALPISIADNLYHYQQGMTSHKYSSAGIGRGDDYLQNEFVRTDEICWISGASDAGQQWIDWNHRLKTFLNRRLFLGLFSFESHFAHYAPGDYYKRHYDAFRGEANRVLSIITYLNPGWSPTDGGELVIYLDDHDKDGIKVVPLHGTIVAFLSEEFPHEVLPATRDRFSVAGWYRVNTSSTNRIDPPQ